MISAVITHLGDARRLEATLATLAPAAIDGLVREALAVDVQADAATRAVADDAGARLVEAASEDAGLALAGAMARGTWLLVLPCGVRLASGWEGAVRRHIERHPSHAGWFAMAVDADSLGARLREAGAAAAGWIGRPGPRHGLLMTHQQFNRALGGAGAIDRASLTRRLGALRPLGVRALS